MYLIKKQNDRIFSIPCREIPPRLIKSISSPLAQKILNKLAEKPEYPKQIARSLNVHEQKIYYHIRKLEKAKIIEPIKTEERFGVIARYYALTSPCFASKFKEFEETSKLASVPEENEFLSPFIQNGELNALIIVGSPDPHGIENARARDKVESIELGLFLGTFSNKISPSKVYLDTETREKELKNNLIILGGPVVNNIAARINDKLPIKFSKKAIVSSISKKRYSDDKAGIILKIVNPFDKTKKILFIAGLRYIGTKACIFALLKSLKELSKGNSLNNKIHARVIQGVDYNSDGIIDDVKILE
jgi:DNA-binding transcriptional ArsR family regulator